MQQFPHYLKMIIRSRNGTILIENLVFLILNVLFLIILILFILRQGDGAILVEQSSAKQIALLIDSAKPGMVIKLNMKKSKEIAEENNIDFEDIVSIEGNIVRVKLSENGGYEYSFFNDVQVNFRPDQDDNYFSTNDYIFIVNAGGENE